MLKTQSLEWFYNNVRKRFRRFGSAKVLKTLYRKHLVERSALSELTGSVFKRYIRHSSFAESGSFDLVKIRGRFGWSPPFKSGSSSDSAMLQSARLLSDRRGVYV